MRGVKPLRIGVLAVQGNFREHAQMLRTLTDILRVHGYATTGAPSGAEALISNTTGFDNTASGARALVSNTIGNFNTASGYEAHEQHQRDL